MLLSDLGRAIALGSIPLAFLQRENGAGESRKRSGK
jgi:hypothetical protein